MEENKLTVGNIVFNRIQETPFIYNEASKLSMPTMRYDITITPDMIERGAKAVAKTFDQMNKTVENATGNRPQWNAKHLRSDIAEYMAKAALEAALGGGDDKNSI